MTTTVKIFLGFLVLSILGALAYFLVFKPKESDTPGNGNTVTPPPVEPEHANIYDLIAAALTLGGTFLANTAEKRKIAQKNLGKPCKTPDGKDGIFSLIGNNKYGCTPKTVIV